MVSSNFNLRNIEPHVMAMLKREAEKHKISVNNLLLQIIKQGFGLTHSKKKIIFHDLDHLAGTWSKEDKKEFGECIKSLEKIDKELWK